LQGYFPGYRRSNELDAVNSHIACPKPADAALASTNAHRPIDAIEIQLIAANGYPARLRGCGAHAEQ
jgi:hypothetical protein